MYPKRGRPPLRKKAFTNTELMRRKRKNKKKRLQDNLNAQRQTKRVEITSKLGILHCAITAITDADLASASVDAVITDPPYALKDVPLYGDLAWFAMRVLKPSGWCLAMTGDLYVDRILPLMTNSGLVYRGLIVVTFPGGHHSRIATTQTFQAAKCIVMLQKPPTRRPPQWGPNFIPAAKNGHDKSLHPWQQSQEVFEKLVQRFTLPGNLVADPFAGSGTTLRAAYTLRRLAWGADIAAKG